MIPAFAFAGRHVAVFGLGSSGRSAARALAAGGAIVHAWDDGEAARAQAEAAGVPLDDINRRDWSLFAALVLAPGVALHRPQPHRVVELARVTGVEIIGDIELFARAAATAPSHLKPKIVGVTGTNGKSTTTALIGHIAASCGRDAQVGGNIGTPALDLEPFHGGAVYVLEVSSYQLDLTYAFKPDVGVLLNLAPDHLDRHGDMASYVTAKRRLFAQQSSEDWAVIGVDDNHARTIATEMRAARGPRVIPVSASRALASGVHAVGGVLYDAIDGRLEEIVDLRLAPCLVGRHNWQNAAAAYAAARALGLDPRRIAQALLTFTGLAHRLEEVARAGPVRFINDSKATNPNAARQALASYENIYWIAGGRPKPGGVEELFPLMPRVSKAYLIGEAAESFAAQLRGRAVIEIARDLETAIAAAARDAAKSPRPDPVVLLSPACASFDQFKNFEHRGDVFRALAQALPGAVAREPTA